MSQPDEDISVLAHIQHLVREVSPDEAHRLAALQVELDQWWDLLRQRRAEREFGEAPGR